MIRRDIGGCVFYQFEIFEGLPFLRHGFSTRLGGVSEGDYTSMNLGVNRGDARAAVERNFEIFCGAVGVDVRNVVLSNQVHETALAVVNESDFGKGLWRESDILRTDGLLTNTLGAALTTFYADCVPLLFADARNKAAAVSHAGWRGTRGGIGAKTVMEMGRAFGSKPEELRVGIGPSIGACCFEVGGEVAAAFPNDCHTNPQTGKPHVDLQAANAAILEGAGVLRHHIEIAGLCTKCGGEFFSHRRAGERRGAMAAMIGIAS